MDNTVVNSRRVSYFKINIYLLSCNEHQYQYLDDDKTGFIREDQYLPFSCNLTLIGTQMIIFADMSDLEGECERVYTSLDMEYIERVNALGKWSINNQFFFCKKLT